MVVTIGWVWLRILCLKTYSFSEAISQNMFRSFGFVFVFFVCFFFFFTMYAYDHMNDAKY